MVTAVEAEEAKQALISDLQGIQADAVKSTQLLGSNEKARRGVKIGQLISNLKHTVIDESKVGNLLGTQQEQDEINSFVQSVQEQVTATIPLMKSKKGGVEAELNLALKSFCQTAKVEFEPVPTQKEAQAAEKAQAQELKAATEETLVHLNAQPTQAERKMVSDVAQKISHVSEMMGGIADPELKKAAEEFMNSVQDAADNSPNVAQMNQSVNAATSKFEAAIDNAPNSVMDQVKSGLQSMVKAVQSVMAKVIGGEAKGLDALKTDKEVLKEASKSETPTMGRR